MSKPVVAIDLDDVLTPHFEGLIQWYNAKYATNLTLEHNHPTDPTPWGTESVKEAVKRVHGYFDTENFKNEQPFEEVTRVLDQLSKNFDLVVITGRDHMIEDITSKWLKKHFPDIFNDVHFTAQYSLQGKSRSKKDVALSTNASYLIDDNLEAVIDANSVGIKGILFGNYPWNKSNKLPIGVVRCRDWLEVQGYLNNAQN